ncbi:MULTISPECIES: heat shock protein HspQ [Gammaproteobacteria]|uniref:heat shock protein HspQ n=1 Tax=Gammaproteobacteria TaxID=1236 RepID=UPI000DD09BCF|nr:MULTISPECIES: heat shock protein HspQ [Gammaproteobacteria]RTE87154.1 heat shock protein HspQ [Aliidiomarina sp. B3213]TCZ93058.1 heat shock protein HspQ [Lysobacter sp. N42]
MVRAKFAIGQVVTHSLYGYRGVIIDADPKFSLSEEWYNRMAHTRPDTEQPWYHILVSNSTIQTYVAEQSLVAEYKHSDIQHPEIESHFRSVEKGTYTAQMALN